MQQRQVQLEEWSVLLEELLEEYWELLVERREQLEVLRLELLEVVAQILCRQSLLPFCLSFL
jgi:hypothetical protein